MTTGKNAKKLYFKKMVLKTIINSEPGNIFDSAKPPLIQQLLGYLITIALRLQLAFPFTLLTFFACLFPPVCCFVALGIECFAQDSLVG